MTLPPLAACAAALLQLVADTAEQEGVVLPERRFVSAGIAGAEAWDCDQVTVALVMLLPQQAGVPGDQVAVAASTPGRPHLPAAQLQVEIVREHPVSEDGQPLPADVENTAGLASLTDAALLARVRARALTSAALAAHAQISVGTISGQGPSGGLSSQRLLLTATLV